MRNVSVFDSQEPEKAKSMIDGFFSMMAPRERVRVICESSSEFSLETNNIRGFYWGWILPNAAEAILGINRLEAQKDRKKLQDIHKKLKMLVLPTVKQDRFVDGRVVEVECIAPMKNATVREWYVYIAAVQDFLEEHWGVDLNQTQHEGYDDFVTLADKFKDDRKANRDFAQHKRRFNKNMKTYERPKQESGAGNAGDTAG